MSVFAPAHHPTPIPVGPGFIVQRLGPAATEKDNIDTDSVDSGNETEVEWTDDAQLGELAQSAPSKVSEVMLVKVRQQF